jgi:transcription elongation factor
MTKDQQTNRPVSAILLLSVLCFQSRIEWPMGCVYRLRLKEVFMKRIVFAIAAAAAVAAAVGYMTPAYGEATGQSTPAFLTEMPPGYRDWKLISASRITAGKLAQLRVQLGNDIAIKAYREGKLPFPDGSMIAAVHWNDAVSDENNKVLAMLSIGGATPQGTVAGSLVNVQFMVKDSTKYAATGGWGFGDFTDGKPANEAAMKTCFACHQPAKDHDFVFARYAPSH